MKGYTNPVPPNASTLLCGRYRLDEVVGRGGVAEVWSAWDERLDRAVAVKVLRPGGHFPVGLSHGLGREAQAAARLNHPNIVRVFDTDEFDGQPFIVMEHLPGDTLADRYEVGEMADGWLTDIGMQVADALAAAHDHGVVHRDVKPGNIMLTADGSAKLGDFGIATNLDVATSVDGDGDGDRTATGLILGTPAYLAPERIEGAPATVAGDVYALGVVLYEGYAKCKPFEGPTVAAVAHAVLNRRPKPLEQIRPDLPATLTRAVDRAMAPAPEDRFDSAAEMAVGLRASRPKVAVSPADSDATVAIPIGATQVTGAFPALFDPANRRRVAVASAGALMLWLLVMTAWAVGGQGELDPAPIAPPATAAETPAPAPAVTETPPANAKGKKGDKGKD
ncbi:MAG: serine/threonine-protein kinase [Acidimicrobiales bacterium]